MEVVKAFNNELSAMYECKPPISKAKMSQVTKAAIRGIKFYKHIVQSVEKFIQKCRPEYKIPGLYVIDSIVRQSRHQFGIDKDVFVPRFSKNMHITFQHLLRCPENDKPRVIKVLNLWQKNGVFSNETLQPLLDIANPDETTASREVASPVKKEDPFWESWQSSGNQSEKVTLSSSTSVQQVAKHKDEETPVLDSALISQLQELTNQLLGADCKPKEEAVKFNKKLLDFDYGDEEEEEEEKEENGHASVEPTALALSMAQNLLSNPELLRQLQQMQQTIQQTEALTKGESEPAVEVMQSDAVKEEPSYFNQVAPPEPANLHTSQQTYTNSPSTFVAPQQSVSALHEVHLPPPISEPVICTDMAVDYAMMQDAIPQQMQMQHVPVGQQDVGMLYHDHDERQVWLPVVKDEDERDHGAVRKDRSRSRSPRSGNRSTRKYSGGGARRSRSRSPPRRGRRSRSRSPPSGRYNRRGGGDKRNSSRDWERDQERERERERRRRGLPPVKKNFLAVCTTTLWLGHVPKVIAEADISEVFAEYGEVSSIDVIPPRGCAYVCMKQRQDASRALTKLRNLILQGSKIKMAWAPGKGVKGKEFKDFWDVEQGTTFIPYDKIPEDVDLDALEEGGLVDEDSMPGNLKEIRQKKEEEKRAKEEAVIKEQQQKVASLLPAAHIPMVPQQMANQFGIPNVPGVVGMPPISMALGVPPPNPMMMMAPHTVQPLLNTQSLMTPIVAPIQGAMSTALSGSMAPLQGAVPTPLPSTVAGSLSSQRPLVNVDDRGDKTPTEDESMKEDKPSSDAVISKSPFMTGGSAMQPQFQAGAAMNNMPAFPPAAFQPFNNRLPLATHLQPNQGIGGLPPPSPWANAGFPRPQGIGIPHGFPPGQLGVIPGMPHQLGGIPNRPLFPSTIPRPTMAPQEFPNVPSSLNVSSKNEAMCNMAPESKNGRGAGTPQGRLSPRLTQDSPSRGMPMPGRGVLGGANAIPLPQDLGFRPPRPMNFPPQHRGRGGPFAFGPRQPFMMRGGMRGPRPSVDFRGSNPNFIDGPFEQEWSQRRQFGPVDRGEPYYSREEFDDWDEHIMPGGRDREMMEDKMYRERNWPRDGHFRPEDDDRRFRSRESRFEDGRRRGDGFRDRSRFDDYRGDREWGRGMRDRSEPWTERERDRSSKRDRDRRSDENESQNPLTDVKANFTASDHVTDVEGKVASVCGDFQVKNEVPHDDFRMKSERCPSANDEFQVKSETIHDDFQVKSESEKPSRDEFPLKTETQNVGDVPLPNFQTKVELPSDTVMIKSELLEQNNGQPALVENASS